MNFYGIAFIFCHLKPVTIFIYLNCVFLQITTRLIAYRKAKETFYNNDNY